MTIPSGLDIRWIQRFSNFQKAYRQLVDAVELSKQRPLSQLEQQGLIKAFEFTQELAWNVLKDYFEYQGNTAITGSRDALREAFKRGLVADGEGWMDTIKSRNRSSHTYDERTADQLVRTISDRYVSLFDEFNSRMQDLARNASI
ncbi:MAG: nucleotidyltransferase substrate binding protein [Rhodocyclaceae bacterium]|nr:nucleotidyltransferase substrate binding protein [Rhodocyclaceae bacterium]